MLHERAFFRRKYIENERLMSKAGNTNALSHGATTAAARRGELPRGFEHLQELIDEHYDGWVSDLGGQENIPKQKESLLLVSRVCLVVILLSLEHLKRSGFASQVGEVQPVLKTMATYMNSMRLNLSAVGLDRATKKADSLEGYLEERYGDKGTSQQAAQKPPRKESRK